MAERKTGGNEKWHMLLKTDVFLAELVQADAR
jgi:hypothetical protein